MTLEIHPCGRVDLNGEVIGEVRFLSDTARILFGFAVNDGDLHTEVLENSYAEANQLERRVGELEEEIVDLETEIEKLMEDQMNEQLLERLVIAIERIAGIGGEPPAPAPAAAAAQTEQVTDKPAPAAPTQVTPAPAANSNTSEGSVPTLQDLRSALTATGQALGRDATLATLQSVVAGATNVNDVAEDQRQAVIDALAVAREQKAAA